MIDGSHNIANPMKILTRLRCQLRFDTDHPYNRGVSVARQQRPRSNCLDRPENAVIILIAYLEKEDKDNGNEAEAAAPPPRGCSLDLYSSTLPTALKAKRNESTQAVDGCGCRPTTQDYEVLAVNLLDVGGLPTNRRIQCMMSTYHVRTCGTQHTPSRDKGKAAGLGRALVLVRVCGRSAASAGRVCSCSAVGAPRSGTGARGRMRRGGVERDSMRSLQPLLSMVAEKGVPLVGLEAS